MFLLIFLSTLLHTSNTTNRLLLSFSVSIAMMVHEYCIHFNRKPRTNLSFPIVHQIMYKYLARLAPEFCINQNKQNIQRRIYLCTTTTRDARHRRIPCLARHYTNLIYLFELLILHYIQYNLLYTYICCICNT